MEAGLNFAIVRTPPRGVEAEGWKRNRPEMGVQPGADDTLIAESEFAEEAGLLVNPEAQRADMEGLHDLDMSQIVLDNSGRLKLQ
jgi:hypothetical protein